MTISTVTTERLKQIASGNAFTCTQDDESTSMAAELLAVREAQSVPVALVDRRPAAREVAWRNGGEKLPHGTQLYAAPPAVPAAIEPTLEAIKAILPTANPDEYACCVGADMWNACRAAMLAAAPTPTKAADDA